MTKYGTFLVLAFLGAGLVVFGILLDLYMGDPNKAETLGPPIVLTVRPTPTPAPRQPQFQFIGGSLDAHFQLQRTPEPDAPSLSYLSADEAAAPYYPGSTVEYNFVDGWAEGGGLLLRGSASAWRLVICESNGNITGPGFHLGLLQWHPSTWAAVAAITGYYDPWNPFHQGFNGGYYSTQMTAAPGGTGGWPVCWWV
jgi:hypothetical protein